MPTPYRQIPLFTSLLFCSCLLNAQYDCDAPNLANGTSLHGNNMRALYAASGSQFWDGENSQFSIETSGSSLNTIFTQGLWVAGIDGGGNIMVSAARYGASNGNSDYYPGPIDELSTDAETCRNYDRAWEVYRYQIEAHQADFADNGVIDNPIPAIVGWPGRGNPEFAGLYGFELPNTAEGLAPFFDLDADGNYEPLAGEYPIEPRHQIIPEHMVWTVFNNSGNQQTDSGIQNGIRMEVHCLAWALNCDENDLLNNTTFANYRFIHRTVEPFDSVRIGLWNDFDLGCYLDDYIGSAPSLNTFFVYNADNLDDENCFGIIGAGENPPVQAVTFLNRPLDAFIYTNSGPGSFPPDSLGFSPRYFNLLQGQFTDGTPITEGGTGYNPGSENVVQHVFPGNPNEPDTWTASAAPLADWRALGSTHLDEWEIGGVIELDVAYSYYREPGLDRLGNVSAMYTGVAALQNLYDTNFDNICEQPSFCAEDCIWSGDLNADGIANHEDAIALGFGLNQSGTTRLGPYNWSPQDGENWANTQLFGSNAKHLDANGDGSASELDFEYILHHYNFTKPGYEATVEYPAGDEIAFVRAGSNSELTGLTPGETFFGSARLELAVEDLRAIAFTLEYEPEFYDRFQPLAGSIDGPTFSIINKEVPGLIDYSYYAEDSDAGISLGTIVNFSVRIRDDFPPDFPTDESKIRFRNIRGYLSDGTAVDLGATDVTIQVDGIVSTQEPAWAQDLRLFPNPVSTTLHLQTSSPIEQVNIYDNQGRLLRTVNNPDPLIDVHALPAGMYHLRIYRANESIIRKFVKQE